jgi:addiction module HigA family antidote
MISTRSFNVLFANIKKLPHPGTILEKQFFIPKGISPYKVSKETGIPQSRLTLIMQGKRGITADTSLRLSAFFGLAPDYFLNLQAQYDLYCEAKKNRRKYLAIKTSFNKN